MTPAERIIQRRQAASDALDEVARNIEDRERCIGILCNFASTCEIEFTTDIIEKMRRSAASCV